MDKDRPINKRGKSMEARLRTSVPFARLVCPALILAFALSPTLLRAAGYRTTNFTVDAPTPQLAKEIGDTAERCRRTLAIEWLGKELPNWSRPCPIKAQVAPNLGAGGATSFVFDQGEVFGWRMNIQGSRERILDSVVPHEVTHTVFASHFRQPIPRWADEGACTTVEHHSEIRKQENMLIEFLRTRRGIPFSSMFAMTEYPQDVLPLYAQGHSLSHFLISQHGKRAFVAFLENGLQDGNWPRAINDQYGHRDLLTLQNTWMDWIRQGRPQLTPQPAGDSVLLASNQTEIRPIPKTIVRGQDPAAGSVYGGNSQDVGPTPGAPVAREWPAGSPPTRSIYDASRATATMRR